MGKEISRIQFPTDLTVFDEIIDVRTRLEFREDHLTGAILLPVLDDNERAEIGTVYKQDSAFEARKQGAALVTQNISRHLKEHFKEKPRDYRALLYCWRGGHRSGSFATVLSDVGFDVSVIEGGYRAYRKMVIDTFEGLSPRLSWIVLNGFTGAGKTLVLKAIRELGGQVLELEGLARHKGSVFGGDPEDPQPAQKRFESLIYDEISQFDPEDPVFVEAESAKIGRLNLPNPIWQQMKDSPVIEIDSPLEARTDYLTEDYSEWLGDLPRVEATLDRLKSFHSKETLSRWKQYSHDEEWRRLVYELLEEHYDIRYTVDGSGHFNPPAISVPLDSHDEKSVVECASKVIASSREVLSSTALV